MAKDRIRSAQLFRESTAAIVLHTAAVAKYDYYESLTWFSSAARFMRRNIKFTLGKCGECGYFLRKMVNKFTS